VAVRDMTLSLHHVSRAGEVGCYRQQIPIFDNVAALQ